MAESKDAETGQDRETGRNPDDRSWPEETAERIIWSEANIEMEREGIGGMTPALEVTEIACLLPGPGIGIGLGDLALYTVQILFWTQRGGSPLDSALASLGVVLGSGKC
ncbi:hypothetical protein CF326_g8295 [Tilletia indica]|nr:hypothetical protein CF326_g8295 [Tilletia indica]